MVDGSRRGKRGRVAKREEEGKKGRLEKREGGGSGREGHGKGRFVRRMGRGKIEGLEGRDGIGWVCVEVVVV